MENKPPARSGLAPEYALLGLLAQRPAHGYELHHRLTSELGYIWRISQSQAYNILKRLEKQGHIHSTTQEQERLPARQLLELTDLGRGHFQDWLKTPTSSSARAIRIEFITRLYFAYTQSAEMIGSLFETQMAETRANLKRLETRLAEIPIEQTFNRLGLELRIRQLKSILDWLAEAQAQLDLQTHRNQIER